jgi:hypothetical protein
MRLLERENEQLRTQLSSVNDNTKRSLAGSEEAPSIEDGKAGGSGAP